MSFPLPVIKDEALQEFCKQHNVYEAVAAGYHYAHKFFPKAKQIDIEFYPPYRDDEPEGAYIDFVIETRMTSDEVLSAEKEFIKATNEIPGAFYLVISYRFTEHDSC
jgi:hypothetical protein